MLCCSYAALADNNFANRPDVQLFIKKMVKKHGFKENELVDLFKTVTIRPPIMQSIKAPLEQKPWYSYQLFFVNQSHIREGVAFWNQHAAALEKVEKQYGVPAGIIVATIGVETKYGKYKGEYPVIDALCNIAFSGSPRAGFFRSELEEFLLLSREQHLNPRAIKGSYAGAIGQPQFMPSSYRRYAVSYAGNNRIDLTNNVPDIIISIANYYKKHGWQANQPVVIPAMMEKNLYRYFIHVTPPNTLNSNQLSRYGILTSNQILPIQKVRVITLQNYYRDEYWIGLHNFEVIRLYNPSNLYAMAVYQLSYYITTLRNRLGHA
jgi:membrane-bound lytic murein transglycosylase B